MSNMGRDMANGTKPWKLSADAIVEEEPKKETISNSSAGPRGLGSPSGSQPPIFMAADKNPSIIYRQPCFGWEVETGQGGRSHNNHFLKRRRGCLFFSK